MIGDVVIALATLYTVIVIHEAGHVIAARYVGCPVVRFHVGEPVMIERYFRGVKIALGPIPWGGSVTALFQDTSTRIIIIALGGVTAELLIFPLWWWMPSISLVVAISSLAAEICGTDVERVIEELRR